MIVELYHDTECVGSVNLDNLETYKGYIVKGEHHRPGQPCFAFQYKNRDGSGVLGAEVYGDDCVLESLLLIGSNLCFELQAVGKYDGTRYTTNFCRWEN